MYLLKGLSIFCFVLAMDDLLTSIVPDKKRTTEVDYQYCIICQENNSESTVVNPKLESIEKLLYLTKERRRFGDTLVNDFAIRKESCTAQYILDQKGSYHRSCFKEFANKSKYERAKARHEKALTAKDVS